MELCRKPEFQRPVQFGTDDDNTLLARVADSMAVRGKQSKDRFIFVMSVFVIDFCVEVAAVFIFDAGDDSGAGLLF